MPLPWETLIGLAADSTFSILQFKSIFAGIKEKEAKNKIEKVKTKRLKANSKYEKALQAAMRSLYGTENGGALYYVKKSIGLWGKSYFHDAEKEEAKERLGEMYHFAACLCLAINKPNNAYDYCQRSLYYNECNLVAWRVKAVLDMVYRREVNETKLSIQAIANTIGNPGIVPDFQLDLMNGFLLPGQVDEKSFMELFASIKSLFSKILQQIQSSKENDNWLEAAKRIQNLPSHSRVDGIPLAVTPFMVYMFADLARRKYQKNENLFKTCDQLSEATTLLFPKLNISFGLGHLQAQQIEMNCENSECLLSQDGKHHDVHRCQRDWSMTSYQEAERLIRAKELKEPKFTKFVNITDEQLMAQRRKVHQLMQTSRFSLFFQLRTCLDNDGVVTLFKYVKTSGSFTRHVIFEFSDPYLPTKVVTIACLSQGLVNVSTVTYENKGEFKNLFSNYSADQLLPVVCRKSDMKNYCQQLFQCKTLAKAQEILLRIYETSELKEFFSNDELHIQNFGMCSVQ